MRLVVFFFSSRRRHTRWTGDWSSDVCSSDLVDGVRPVLALFDHEEVGSTSERGAESDLLATVLERIVLAAGGTRDDFHQRSEERRVGKECRSRRSPCQ